VGVSAGGKLLILCSSHGYVAMPMLIF